MYGCEWDDEFKDIRGYHQYGYDGKDFIIFDLNTEMWIAPKEQAVITKHKWDHDADWNIQTKHYLTQDCIEWLKKYVDYGQHSLKRTGRMIYTDYFSFIFWEITLTILRQVIHKVHKVILQKFK